MNEQRRHRRIRFAHPPTVTIGQRGRLGEGELHNLSLGGLMLRTALPLRTGESFGCEFSVFGSPRIDMPAQVVNCIGDLYGVRFQAGPLSEVLIQEAIDKALAEGEASILSIHDVNGRKVMRISGGLNNLLASDFMHGLTRVGVAEIDLSEVTTIDTNGVALCMIAAEQYQVSFAAMSPQVQAILHAVLPGFSGSQ
ncbi:PilZ domain-containing protein [Rhodocyclus tenuis]|uniref:ABC-type transporter Mla MlaB component n=1 Tax=Rhodocyclus tenuis TaxID=1066 RepID=A0A840G049_RHOTE|nr:PilZ domain-containing protein [Rhodocyclus tenuis]MBB4245853.1 ABC-type transporter Mla MlaB component [Rhodocyclus tenuis]MBK1680578.1 hypothetical protein [Rhodocyclus tenuis]